MRTGGNWDALQQFVKTDGDKLQQQYEGLLLGKNVVEFQGVEVSTHIHGKVVLDDGQIYDSHYRWSTKEEEDLKAEIVGLGMYPMKDYYEHFIVNKAITKVDIGCYDRDDEIYVYAYIEEDIYLEIPLGITHLDIGKIE